MIYLGTERVVYDLAFFYNFGKLGEKLNEAAYKNSDNFTSLYASLETVAQAEIDKYFEALGLSK